MQREGLCISHILKPHPLAGQACFVVSQSEEIWPKWKVVSKGEELKEHVYDIYEARGRGRDKAG